MTPQLYITAYKEQFASPGRVNRAQPRPTSAHRRNNPQPRPDFLFPRSLQSRPRPTITQPHPSPPVGLGRPLLPPVRHLSFNSPFTTSPSNRPDASDQSRSQRMPPVNPAAEPSSPSAAGRQSLQLSETQRRPDHQRNAHLLPPRQRVCFQLPARPHTSSPPAASRHAARVQNCRPQSNSALEQGSCYSCFHVVKPHQAGHYIIHPEFVSECLS